MSGVFKFIIIVIRTLVKWGKYEPRSKYPFGHFYSPIVSGGELIELEDQIWEDVAQDSILGINLNLENQLLLLKEFSKYYPEMPFKDEKSDKHRYCFNNGTYAYTDAIVLYSFIRHFKPKKIIEIGSGHSSAVMLDTRETFVNDINDVLVLNQCKLDSGLSRYSVHDSPNRFICRSSNGVAKGPWLVPRSADGCHGSFYPFIYSTW